MNDIQDKIAVTQTQVNHENDPLRKQELQKKLRKLLLQKEIEDINIRIKQLGDLPKKTYNSKTLAYQPHNNPKKDSYFLGHD